MATIAADPIQAGYRGFASFAELIDEPLEQHERRIARAHFGAEREVYAPCIDCGALIPSGSYCGRCQPDYAPERLRGRAWVRRRAAVMRRAGWICETPGCGRIAQQVHHVDGDPGNNAMTNLLGVCVPCHRALEAEKRG